MHLILVGFETASVSSFSRSFSRLCGYDFVEVFHDYMAVFHDYVKINSSLQYYLIIVVLNLVLNTALNRR